MSLQSIADRYFSSLNPIAARLCTDLEETKASYEELWNKIPEDERNQILNESIIKPEVVIKYDASESGKREEYATKIIVEDHGSYRDEHSGPFSFRTPSQRDLSLFKSDSVKNNNVVIKKEPNLKPKKMPIIYRETKFIETNNDDILTVETSTAILPKTGLDFLDNW